MERRSQFAVYYPADPGGIAELLASNDPVDASYLLERVAADKRAWAR